MSSPRLSVVLSAAVLALAATASANAASAFGSVLSENGTSAPGSVFLGAPDDAYLGLGGAQVTYDFGVGGVVNRAGAVDFNVYKVDSGSPEFNVVTVLVSVDGSSFVSVDASESPLVRIAGDGTHGNNSFGRSFGQPSLPSRRLLSSQGVKTQR
jgi:hypothetical protein